MKNRYHFLTLILFAALFINSCGGEADNPRLESIPRSQTTYAEVRQDINPTGETLKGDVTRRLDVLEIFIEDLMEKYETADTERKKMLRPKVEKLKNLMNRVRGSVKTYTPGKEKMSEEQKQEIVDTMQELRDTYHDLVTRLGVTWH